MNKSFLSLNKIIVAACCVFFVLLVIYATFNKKGILRTIDLSRKIDGIKESVKKLKNENRLLAEAIRSYKSEDFQVEKIAREDLGMAKKNEVIIKIIREKKYPSDL